MSIPAHLRKVKDTESNAKSNVIDACKKLYIHAVKLCSAKKVQMLPTYFLDLADTIVEESLEIYQYCFRANSIPFYHGKISEENYNDRVACIIEAMRLCSDLQGLITLGKTSFRWRDRQIEYWTGIIISTREMISNWYSWTIREYKGQES